MIASKTSRLAAQIENGQTIGLTFHYHNKTNIRFIGSLIKKILSYNDIIYLNDTLFTVLREIIVNAVKANSKRFYFNYHNLDITNDTQYLSGMQQFKSFIIENQELVENELKKSNYRVGFYLKKSDDGLKIYVRNNTPIHPDELKRIEERIEKAKTYNDFAEVYADVTDDSEGEGLGLLLTILFLRNSGIGENSLSIKTDGKITQSTLTVPYQLKPVSIVTEIQSQIVDEVKELPSFPEHVLEIQRLCNQPDVNIKVISDKIIMDPALTTSVLKLSNSAGFITRKRIENINDAIKIIGLNNLKAILVASSARTIMDQKYSVFKEIWNHCNRTAFYARHIAMSFNNAKIAENVYLAGLLHDLGKIVLLSTSGSLSNWISDVTRSHSIRTTTIIEELSIGISHSSIGELIGKKWNLPEYLITAIKHHHSPLIADEKYRPIINIVYLANEMCNIESHKYDYSYIDEEVLELFDLNDEEKFNLFHEEAKQLYDEQSKLLAKA
jgi:HD-like signal output (HDOD) protein